MKAKPLAAFSFACWRTLAVVLLGVSPWLAPANAHAGQDFHWNNPSGGDWINPFNWLPTNGPPGLGDNAIITAPGTYTVTGSANVTGLTLGDGVSSFPTLLLTNTGVSVRGTAVAAAGTRIFLTGGDGSYLFGGGSLEVDGGLELHGKLDWQAGVLSGTVTVHPDGVITGSTALNHYYSANVYNHGQIRWSANNLTSGGSWLENESDGLVDFQNDGYFGTFGGASSFNVVVNYGTMRKSGGTNAWSFAGCYYLTNAGAMEVQSGSVELDNNVSLSGTISVSNGAALKLVSAIVTLRPGYSFTGQGYYGVPPNGSAIISGTIGDANFRMDGTLSGTNTVTGTMSGYNPDIQGVTTVASGGTLNLDGCTSCGGIYWTIRIGGTLTNAGTVNWLSGDWTSFGGNLVNAAGGLISIQCDNSMGGWDGNANWLNQGIIRKTAGTNVNSFNAMILNNAGLVELQSGGLSLSAGLSNSGTVSVAANTSFSLAGGNVYLNPGGSFIGAGFYGVPPYDSPAVYGDIIGTNFQLLGRLYGSNTVSGTVVVANVNYYSPGEFDGATTINPGGVVNLTGASAVINGPLTNNGTINWLSGTWYDNSAPFANLGTVNIECDYELGTGGAGNWLNLGTVRKSGTTGITTVSGSSLVNNALLDVQTGTLAFQNGFASSGTINVAPSSALFLAGGDFYLNPGSTFTGAGFYGVQPNYAPAVYGDITGANFQMSGRLYGTNTVSGTVVVANINFYSPGEFDGSTTINPGGVVNLTGPSASINGPLTNKGTINWLAGDWNLNYGAPFANLGTVNVQCDNTLASGGPGGWLNLGTVRKRGTTGTTTVTGTGFVNDALLDVQSGAVQFQSAYTQTGGQLNFGLAGPAQFGQVIFANPAPLTGTLSVNLLGGYSPAYGDSFNLLTYPAASGAFSNFSLPPLTGLKSWSETNSVGALILSVVKGQPSLSITSSGGGINLAWSSDADPDHRLKYTTNLAPPVLWMDMTNGVQVIGGQNVVNFTPLMGNVFFKLQ